MPHTPQFNGSMLRFTQALPHGVWPGAQDVEPVPAVLFPLRPSGELGLQLAAAVSTATSPDMMPMTRRPTFFC